MKIRNPLIKKILIILGVIIFLTFTFVFAFKSFLKNYSNLVYDLGEKDIINYSDVILQNYNQYIELTKIYNISADLNENDFNNNYFLASFQEYDKCSEKKYKSVESISVNDFLNIEYKVYNKCGLCKSHLTLHIIKIDKVDPQIKIKYNYAYERKNLNCGNV